MGKDETTYKLVSIPRYQREWLRQHRTINVSGLIQRAIIEEIKARDPAYYEKYKEFADRTIRREETTIRT